MAEIPFESDAENQGRGGLEYNGNEIPQDKIDFITGVLKTLYGPNYLEDQIRENDLSPETTWNDLVANQINRPDFPQMIEIISENVSLALQAAKQLDAVFLERIGNLSPTDQKVQIKRMKLLAKRDHNLDYGSDYHDIHLQLAFETYVDSIEFWNRLLLSDKSK